MSLVANYDSNSSSSTEENDQEEEKEDDDNNKPKQKFKLPDLNINDVTCAKTKSFADTQQRKFNSNSVYSNPYIKQQEESLSIISKHKELSEEQQKQNHSRHKKNSDKKKRDKLKLCMNFFKKGTCKYGDKCKFLHSIITDDVAAEDEDGGANVSTPGVNVSKEPCKYKTGNLSTNPPPGTFDEPPVLDTDDVTWEGGGVIKDSRKRIGLSDNVVPSKRALKMYKQQQKL